MGELAEASDLRTPAARLRALAQHVRRDVQAAVARNPSSPWPVLLELVGSHTDDVLTNPALPLLELEYPLLWADLEWSARAVAASRHVPLSFVSWCLAAGPSDDRDSVRWHLVQNLAVPLPQRLQVLGSFAPQHELRLGAKRLEVLVGDDWARRLRGLGLHGSFDSALSEADQQALYALGPVTHLLLARHPATTPELVSALMESRHLGVASEAARHPHLPELWRELLVTSQDVAHREWVAHNPALSQGLVCQLAAQGPASVAEALATHARLPEKLVADWAHRAHTRVRLALVSRPSLAPEVREVLAGDRESNVRARVAGLPALPEALVHALARDPAPEVRAALALNVATPLALRHQLEQDPEVAALRRRGWRGRRA